MKKIKIIFFNQKLATVYGLEKIFEYELSQIKHISSLVIFATKIQDVMNEILVHDEHTEIVLITGTTHPGSEKWDFQEFLGNTKKVFERIIIISYSYIPCRSEHIDASIDRSVPLKGSDFKAEEVEALKKRSGVYSEVSNDVLFDFPVIQFMLEILQTTTRAEIFSVIEKHKTPEPVSA